jgi:hypothetical protein
VCAFLCGCLDCTATSNDNNGGGGGGNYNAGNTLVLAVHDVAAPETACC